MKLLNCVAPIFLYILSTGCWISSTRTPQRYKNSTKVDSETYKWQRQQLHDSIRSMVDQRRNPFYQSDNGSSTEIYIDTILYNPEKTKTAFFVITKNKERKNNEESNIFNYRAHCLIANIVGSKFTNIRWLSYYNISGYESLTNTSSRIREMHFLEFKNRPKNGVKYNLDDVRFWGEPVWR